jgi:hypothetical protein
MHTTERFGARAGKSGRKGGGPHDQGDLRHKRMSLDGFVTASGVRPEEPMGDGGQRLHEWASGEDDRNRRILEDAIAADGAGIAGRTTYDT